jgi:hypothetical protein
MFNKFNPIIPLAIVVCFAMFIMFKRMKILQYRIDDLEQEFQDLHNQQAFCQKGLCLDDYSSNTSSDDDHSSLLNDIIGSNVEIKTCRDPFCVISEEPNCVAEMTIVDDEKVEKSLEELPELSKIEEVVTSPTTSKRTSKKTKVPKSDVDVVVEAVQKIREGKKKT